MGAHRFSWDFGTSRGCPVAEQCLEYGTQVVAGVTPGRASSRNETRTVVINSEAGMPLPATSAMQKPTERPGMRWK